MPQRFQIDRLAIEVREDRVRLGAAAAASASASIRNLLAAQGKAAVVFASAVSQNEFLAALGSGHSIDWKRVTAFHLDEYARLPATHPASFRRYLREHLVDHVPLGAFHELHGDPGDIWKRNALAIRLCCPTSLLALGIGENGHLVFIDPGDVRFQRSARREDRRTRPCLPHAAGARCRFRTLAEVPRRALSLTVPFFIRTPVAVVSVPGRTKQEAVRNALDGAITEACPASALRRHPHATLFLDMDSAGLLSYPARA